MTFSDHKLKRLKEIIKTDIKDYPLETSPYIRIDVAHSIRDCLPDLITRLEAAERVCGNVMLEDIEGVEEWRKAAGK